MPYIINKTDGTPLITLNDATVDTSTSVGLVGRNYVGYGEIQNENFVFLLENFANDTAPTRPLSGQTWFDTATKTLNVYTGQTWIPVNSAIVSETEPASATDSDDGVIGNGVIWFKSDTKQLFLFNNGAWNLIGPNGLTGYGITDITAQVIKDTGSTDRPVLIAFIDDIPVAVISKDSFTISGSTPIAGFSILSAGITLSSGMFVSGDLKGNADSASRLQSSRTINGIPFNGTASIEIKAPTPSLLNPGSYVVGSQFDGSISQTWSVDASSENITNKVVVRDQAGNFSAGTITANLTGNVSGNVNTATGTSYFNKIVVNEVVGATLSGNALTATRLQTPRKINGVNFDGSVDITVPVSGLDVTGDRLASNVARSELTSLGILNEVRIQNAGVKIGNDNLTLSINQNSKSTLLVNNANGFAVSLTDSTIQNAKVNFEFLPSNVAQGLGGESVPAFVGTSGIKANLGLPTRTFKTVYADEFTGVSAQARYADLAENYVADNDYDKGTILEFGGEYEVTLALDSTNKVAGVVSLNPAYLMNSDCSGNFVVAVALQGRVPCKVKGPVKKGDLMISAGNGFAKSSQDPKIGTVIGKSLENFDGDTGLIEVVVGRI